jgi:hypothetical protein
MAGKGNAPEAATRPAPYPNNPVPIQTNGHLCSLMLGV